jgi:hypothetical protein
MGSDNPLATIHGIRDLGFRQFDVADPRRSLDGWAVADTCQSCLERNIAHPVIHRIRSLKKWKSKTA